MPRIKKVKLIEKYLRSLNYIEQIRLLYWYDKHRGHNTLISCSSASGIGTATLIRCTDCKNTEDITDYGAW